MLIGVWVDWLSNIVDKNLFGEWYWFVGGYVWVGFCRVCFVDY